MYKGIIRKVLNNIFPEIVQEDTDTVEDITDAEMDEIYSRIIDKLVHNIFFSTVENEILLDAFIKLSRLEKIIVVFDIMLDCSPSDIAELVNSNSNSIYSQKYKALQKLRKALGVK